MSEISQHQQAHVAMLHDLYRAILNRENAAETIRSYDSMIQMVTPSDVVVFVHELVMMNTDMDAVRMGINKLLNVTYKALLNYPYVAPADESYFDLCIRNNRAMVKITESIRPVLIQFNKNTGDRALRNELASLFKQLLPFMNYYVIKENILFPMIESEVAEFKCISVMWSFHDQIRRDLNDLVEFLDSGKEVDLKQVNRWAGDLFFNTYAVKFREERILFPVLEQKIEPHKIEHLWNESVEMGFPYYNPPKKVTHFASERPTSPEHSDLKLHDLKTGLLTIEQLVLIFNHLPVDLTYVDEHNKVRFFSTPPHRIFPRTVAIIGRDLNNCHPHESVHVVEKIVESFRDGSRDKADFWINMRGKKILIQYFAVRDDDGNYRGVLEASQEISAIQALEGERRILDWD
jgi:DUF438 domain-containing protein